MEKIIIPAIAIVVVLLIVLTGYLKAPPDTAYIVSGLRKKVVIGKACVKLPILERLDKVSLKLIPIDVKTSSAVPTADYININVDAAVNVKVSDEPEKLELAAQNFLNQTTEYIGRVAREVLEGNMREIVGRMELKEMVSDRQKFAELVKENAAPDLAAMGLDIVSFNVQNFTDSNGVIDDLGIDNISQIKKGAAIAKATANKEVAIAQAAADKQANDARVEADMEIAQRKTELAMRQSDLKKQEDTKRAEADAAYEIQKEEQRKSIEIAAADANIAAQEKAIDLKKKEAEVEEQALNASICKKADAELYRRQKDAEADKFERERDAEARMFEKQKEAEGIRMVGEAEAEAIRKKGIAEAEAMEKKAEAYQKYNGAAMGEMLIRVLPQIAGEIAKPLAAIDKVTVIGSDGQGVSSVADGVPAVMAKLFESMKETVGIDLADIIRADGYDAKVNRNITLNGELKGMEQKAAENAAASPDGPESTEKKDADGELKRNS